MADLIHGIDPTTHTWRKLIKFRQPGEDGYVAHLVFMGPQQEWSAGISAVCHASGLAPAQVSYWFPHDGMSYESQEKVDSLPEAAEALKAFSPPPDLVDALRAWMTTCAERAAS